MRRFVLLVAVVAIAAAESRFTRVSAQTRTLTVAAASDLQAAMPEVVKGFEREAKATVTVSFGSSGNFFAQIQNGAPYDVFLSADIDYPRRLVASGHADTSSLYQYATGRIVLWTRKDSGVDISGGLRSLTGAQVMRIAIANPKYAPYGRAAEARAAIRKDLRRSTRQARAGREHLADGTARRLWQRDCRHHCVIRGRRPDAARAWHLRRDTGRDTPAD
jgi:ABC-type molybdate transport system substrate-binding protein